MARYDPFAAGPFGVSARNFEARDPARDRVFPIEVWRPGSGREKFPLILFSHAALQHRRSATFLCTHLCSHGYVVAALDHSETVAPELARRAGESEEQKHARWRAIVDSRVPDIRFLLDRVLSEEPADGDHIGVVGHSAGGWTALAAPDLEPRIRAIVALAPGGASNPRPGVLPVTLDFKWRHDIPTLFLVAENDASLPLDGMIEIFDRTPATKRMLILRKADHMHFVDDTERLHEGFRTMQGRPELSEIQNAMLPMSQLTSPEHAHLFVRGLTLAHFDDVLKAKEDARRFFAGDLQQELAARGVAVLVH